MIATNGWGRRNARSPRRPRATRPFSRRLNIEHLEQRDLLSVTLTGRVLVADLPGQTAGEQTAVRDARIEVTVPGIGTPMYGWTDANGFYEVSGPGTPAPGNVEVTVRAESRRQVNGRSFYVVHDARASSPWPDRVFQDSLDFVISPDGFGNFVVAAPDFVVDHPFPGVCANAFGIFTILKTYADYAENTLGLAFSHNLNVRYPYASSNFGLNSWQIRYIADTLSHADTIGHEFGHYVHAEAAGRQGGALHYGACNQRTLPSPSAGDDLTADDKRVAFDEGFASYFAVAADYHVGTEGLYFPAITDRAYHNWVLDSTNGSGAPSYNGCGEDDELSIARFLWQADVGKTYDTGEQISGVGGRAVFDNVGSMRTLEDLFETGNEKPSWIVDGYEAVGRLLQANGISPTAMSSVGDRTVWFSVPRVRRCDGTYTEQPLFTNFKLGFYNNSWDPLVDLEVGLSPLTKGLNRRGPVLPDHFTFEYKIPMTQWHIIRAVQPDHSRFRNWFVDGTGTPNGSSLRPTGPYMSNVARLEIGPTTKTSGRHISATEGTEFTETVATCADPDGLVFADLADYSATMHWNDGTPDTTVYSTENEYGQIVWQDENDHTKGFDVRAKDTYNEDGTYAFTVSVSEDSVLVGSADALATVADAPLMASAVSNLTAEEGTRFFDRTVATFTDPAPHWATP